jgi:voltage-gated potassium channel
MLHAVALARACRLMSSQIPPPTERDALNYHRWRTLRHLERLLDRPIMLMAFVWLALLITDFTVGLSPVLQYISYAIWVVFGLHFFLTFAIAPDKRIYMRHNWLVGLSLVLPAFGILRLFRALRLLQLTRAVRTVGLLRLITSLNRSMAALRAALGRRGIGFVVLLTILVIFAGAAGMLFFESPAALREAGQDSAGAGAGIASYGEAVWWTAMLMTTIGTDVWPRTAEGRVLAWLISVYALAVFGYLTGTIASYFVGVDRAHEEAGPRSHSRRIAALHGEIAELRAQLAARQPANTPADGNDHNLPQN